MIVLLCQAYSENFTGLELEDGGGRGTSGSYFYVGNAGLVNSPYNSGSI